MLYNSKCFINYDITLWTCLIIHSKKIILIILLKVTKKQVNIGFNDKYKEYNINNILHMKKSKHFLKLYNLDY